MGPNAPCFFDPARISEKSGSSSSELSSAISDRGTGRGTGLGFDKGSRGFLSCAGRERCFSERANMRSSSDEGSKAIERKMAFGLMSFIFLHTGPAFHIRCSSQLEYMGREWHTGTETFGSCVLEGLLC
jgi:hypothetical protein